MSTTTGTYGLALVEETDALSPYPFNSNALIVEEALSALDARIAALEASISSDDEAEVDEDTGSTGELEGEGVTEGTEVEETEGGE